MRTLHRAPWVLPISSPAIADGAVIVDDEEIVAVGIFAEMGKESYDAEVDHESRILMPGLINCHCHLELSAFAGQVKPPAELGNMPAWIADLLALRVSSAVGDDVARQMCNAALADQYGDGTALVVDIGNGLLSLAGQHDGVKVEYFTELLGLSKQGTDFGLQTLAGHDSDHRFTCHAPYSTSRELLVAVKERAQATRQLFPIHIAESLDEIEFLESGEGRFRTFLDERGVWDGSFAVPGIGPVRYLADLGILDEQTLCVHCVHLSDDEIELLAQKKAKVCLCPGSNRFLGVGMAQPAKMLAAGIRPALGTDSLASNLALSMWREMALIAEDHPYLSPETILAMATLHGAEAIGDSRKGCLQAGSFRHFLAVEYEGNTPLEFLVCDQVPKEIIWL